MNHSIDSILARMMARGGPPFHEVAAPRGPLDMLRRLLGLPSRTHYYERLDGHRVWLTRAEASEIAPIELEMGSIKLARRTMLERRRRMAG